MKLAANNVRNVFKAGQESRVVLATSSSGKVREVHPVSTYSTHSTEFDDPVDLARFPISIHEGPSNLLSGTIENGAYRPKLTSDWAKQTRIFDQAFDGNEITIEFVAIDMRQKNYPSGIVIGAGYYASEPILFDFGTDGFRLYVLDYEGSSIYDQVVNMSIPNGSKFTIKRVLDSITIYINDVFVQTFRNPALDPDDYKIYVGFTTYTTAADVSSSFANMKITGSTNQLPTPTGLLDVPRVSVPRSAWTEIAYFYIAQPGYVEIALSGYAWKTSTSLSQRRGKIFVNGTEIFHLTNQNGGSMTANVTLTPNSRISLQAFTDAPNSNDRDLAGGIIDVYPIGE